MRIDIITIFPGMFQGVFDYGIIAKARKQGDLDLRTVDLRDFAEGAHRVVDDRPFGGGEGMVLKPEPLARAIRSLQGETGAGHVIYLTPHGGQLSNRMADRLCGFPHLILLCGRYEGIDHRVVETFVDEEVSIGDFVLSGGEFPAMVLTEIVARHIPGAVGHPLSLVNESFEGGLLDYPVYTRPADFEGSGVPEVLLSGDHQAIRRWREEQSRAITRAKRPDLLDKE